MVSIQVWRRLLPGMLLLLITVVALAMSLPSRHLPAMYPDSFDYLTALSDRPPVFSALASLLGRTYALVVVQTVISIACWTLLGFSIASIPGAVIGACFAISAPVFQWNQVVLSESLSFSFMALLIAVTFWTTRKWTWWRCGLWIAVAAAFAFTRLGNIYLLPFMAVPFVVTRWRPFFVIAVAAVCICLLALHRSATIGIRLEAQPLTNIIMRRILPDRNAREDFIKMGMPCDERVMAFAGKHHGGEVRKLWGVSPEFNQWVRASGAGAYKIWLLRHPRTFVVAWQAIRDVVMSDCPYYGKYTRRRPASIVTIPLHENVVMIAEIWAFAVFLPFGVWLVTRRLDPASITIAALIAGAYVQAYIGFHGDSVEVHRHLLPAVVLHKITVLWLFAWFIGVAWKLRDYGDSSQNASSDGCQAN